MRRAAIVLAGTVAALLGVAPAAGARVDIPLDAALYPSPLLAGDRVVWLEGVHPAPTVVRAAPVTGGTPATLATVPAYLIKNAKPTSTTTAVSVAAAPGRVLVNRAGLNVYGSKNPEYAPALSELGLVGERPFANCPSAAPYPGSYPAPFDVDADTAVYRDACAQPAGNVRVRDLATGATETIPDSSASGLGTVRVAGRYVAYQLTRTDSSGPSFAPAAEVVVWDRVTRTPVYSVQSGRDIPPIASWDLQADGTLAVAYLDSDDEGSFARAAWFSVAEPRAHAFPVLLAEGTFGVSVPNVQLADGLLGTAVPTASCRAEFVTVSLSGRVRPVVCLSDVGSGAWDFDGRRVAYPAQLCRGNTIRVDTLADEPPPSTGPLDCRPSPLGGDVPVDAKGRARVRVSCRDGCDGRLTLLGKLKFSGKKSLVQIGSAAVRFPPGRVGATVKVQLTGDARKALARSKRIAATLSGTPARERTGITVGVTLRAP